jgi:hypothetical protein
MQACTTTTISLWLFKAWITKMYFITYIWVKYMTKVDQKIEMNINGSICLWNNYTETGIIST